MSTHTTHYKLHDPSWQHLADHKKLPSALAPYSFLSLFFDSANPHLTIPDQIFLSDSSSPLSAHPSSSFSSQPHPSLHTLSLHLQNLPKNIAIFLEQLKSAVDALPPQHRQHLSLQIIAQPLGASNPYSPPWLATLNTLNSTNLPYQLDTPTSAHLPDRTFVPQKPIGVAPSPHFSLFSITLLHKANPLISFHARLGHFKLIFTSLPPWRPPLRLPSTTHRLE